MNNIWKTNLTNEIIHLEDNLDQIYYTAGLKPHRIVREDDDEEDADGLIIENQDTIKPELRDYESIINEQVDNIVKAADNICKLISSVTDFELAIPVLVLLKLANRVGSIKNEDFKKKVPGGFSKKFIYNKISLQLINISLSLNDWISTILSTNILPFQPFINHNLLNLLAWTRTSHLRDHDSGQYYTIRMKILAMITRMVENLSLNINLDSKQLASLIEEELIDDLDVVKSEDSIEDQYACQVLHCIDRLIIVYVDFLPAKLEARLKNFIVQTCIKIYRDFDQNVIGLACRRQLLRLLENISNRPFGTSTTELAWHIFELCDKMELDPEIRYIARRSIKFGLAHRPTLVSNFEVYDCYAKKMDLDGQASTEVEQIREGAEQIGAGAEQISAGAEKISAEAEKISAEAEQMSSEVEQTSAKVNHTSAEINHTRTDINQTNTEINQMSSEVGQISAESKQISAETEQISPETEQISPETEQMSAKAEQIGAKAKQLSEEFNEISEDEQIKPYIDLFVDSLVPK